MSQQFVARNHALKIHREPAQVPSRGAVDRGVDDVEEVGRVFGVDELEAEEEFEVEGEVEGLGDAEVDALSAVVAPVIATIVLRLLEADERDQERGDGG